eukprot:6808487-Prymnesium_polylepis.2
MQRKKLKNATEFTLVVRHAPERRARRRHVGGSVSGGSGRRRARLPVSPGAARTVDRGRGRSHLPWRRVDFAQGNHMCYERLRCLKTTFPKLHPSRRERVLSRRAVPHDSHCHERLEAHGHVRPGPREIPLDVQWRRTRPS